jgi:AMIN domain
MKQRMTTHPLLCSRTARRALLCLMTFAGAWAYGEVQSGPRLPKPPSPVNTAGAKEPAVISRVKLLLDKHSLSLEVLATRPVTPTITALEGPRRLVIDLPNAKMSAQRKRIPVDSDEISAVRLNQYLQNPPVARVVLDLRKPLSYTLDTSGNRLIIRLHAEGEQVTAKPPSATSLSGGGDPAVVPVSLSDSGTVVFADRLAPGASVAAGSDATVLRLPRGGEVRVCPRTNISVTHSRNGPDLMLGMSNGAMETHYALENSADSVLTPDFRILLRGPGEFHYAISADSHGNTCVRTLPGDTAPVLVSELMGDETFKVNPGEQYYFPSGASSTANMTLRPRRLTDAEADALAGCGCPGPSVPVLRTALPPTEPVPAASLQAPVHLAQPGDEAKPIPKQAGEAPSSPVNLALAEPETAALPPVRPNDVHVKVDARFVFPAPGRPATAAAPAPIREARNLPFTMRPTPVAALITPPAPDPPRPAKLHKGAMGKLKSFFSGMFH